MTDKQNELIAVLAARKIAATFSGRVLRGEAAIKRANGKTQKQSFSIEFDDATTLDGPRVFGCRGTYGESFARDAFFESIRLGQGDLEAVRFANECALTGVRSGASQEWIDSHRGVAGSVAI